MSTNIFLTFFSLKNIYYRVDTAAGPRFRLTRPPPAATVVSSAAQTVRLYLNLILLFFKIYTRTAIYLNTKVPSKKTETSNKIIS
jgi:hypothetical protein